MANLTTVPQNVPITISYSASVPIGSGFQQKFVPKNIDGTIFDCTGLDGATFNVLTPTALYPQGVASNSLTVGTADATGVVLSCSETVAAAIADIMQTNSAKYSIQATDGTNISLVGIGQITLNIVP